MKLVYPFTSDQTPDLEQVGGKGLSLIYMKQRNLPVPPGFVLTVDFFEPWLTYIQSLPEWEKTLKQFPVMGNPLERRIGKDQVIPGV